ncbi:MAG: hypothetical protein JWO20_574 [Candidatus Angelobacter sp.]|jgi:hypothetical protein|nr:hypothetical protein [Candidatus Angelobacter sp.]
MKTLAPLHLAGTILFALLASITVSAQNTPKPPEPSPLIQISWLTGGTWVAEIKGEPGAVTTRIENRIRWSENGQLIKFVTTFISHNKPEVHYEGIYAWDPVKKQISFWYSDNEGNLTQGTAAMVGETLTQDFDIAHMNGRVDKLRSLIVRDTPDSYQWNVSAPKEGKWAELLHLHYTREK